MAVGGVEFERGNHPRMQRRLSERRRIVPAELEHEFLDVVEAGVRTCVRGVGDSKDAGGESERKCRVEIRFVPQLVARAAETRRRALQSGIASMQAVPRSEVQAGGLQPGSSRLQR